MITKRVEFGKIEILVDGQIQLREDTVIEEDGVELSRTYHRSILKPDMDPKTITDTRLSAIIPVLWTQAVIDAYNQKKPAPIIPPTVG